MQTDKLTIMKIEQFYQTVHFLIKKTVFPRVIRKTFTVCDLVKCSLSDIHRLIQQKGFTLKQNDPWNHHPVVLQR